MAPEVSAELKKSLDNAGVKDGVQKVKSLRKVLNQFGRGVKALASFNKFSQDYFEGLKKKDPKVLDDEPRESLTL